MERIRPLIGSVDAPDHRQPWRIGGLWRRTINLYVAGGALLTLHHRGQGVSPGGWVVRHRDFIRLHAALRTGASPIARNDGIQVGDLLLMPPRRRCSLRLRCQSVSAYLPPALMSRPEETGLFGPLSQAIELRQHPELRQLRHCFASALAGNAVDWRLWLGKGPGSGERQLFTLRQRGALRFAADAFCLRPATWTTSRARRRSAAGDGAYLRRRHASGILAGATSYLRTFMKTLVVALGGNALLQRGEALTVENQYRNIDSAVPALARLAQTYRLAIVHGNGPQVGLLALQNLAYGDVEPYPLDVLVAESQGMIGYMLAQRLAQESLMPPVSTVMTRITVSSNDPAFSAPEKFIGPVYDPELQKRLEDEYGWRMKRDGKYVRRVVPSPTPVRIEESESIATCAVGASGRGLGRCHVSMTPLPGWREPALSPDAQIKSRGEADAEISCDLSPGAALDAPCSGYGFVQFADLVEWLRGK